MTEAQLEDSGSGLAPSSEAWFDLNVRDAGWLTSILMVGTRSDDEQLLSPVSDLARRYGASAEKETPDRQQAYAPFERPRPGKPSYWRQLPWA